MSDRQVAALSAWAQRRADDPLLVDEHERSLWLLIVAETERYLLYGCVVEGSTNPAQSETLFDTPSVEGVR